jgi:hypothetical protein
VRSAPAITALLALLALAGCVPQSEEQRLASVSRDAAAALDGLSGEQRLDVVAELTAASIADVRAVWGMDAALGSDANALFGVLGGRIEDAARADAPVMQLAGASAGGGIANGIGMGFVLVGSLAKGAIGASNDGTIGRDSTDTNGVITEVFANADNTAGGTITADFSQGGAQISVNATTEVQPCPDPEGRVELHAQVAVTFSGNGAGGSIDLEVTATGLVDDDANLVGSNHSYRHQYSEHEGGKGQFLDHSYGLDGELTVNRHSSAVTAEFAENAARSAGVLAEFIAKDLLDAAEEGWMSGRCVDLQLIPSEDPGSLEPESELVVIAAPHATADGAETGGTVLAAFSGQGSVDPTGTQVPAEAEFIYTAPSETKKGGVISFTSRSNRGVGIATLNVTTGKQAYSAYGHEGEYTGRGTICSLTAEFVISGDGLKFTFTPASEFEGSYRVTGIIDGVTFTGDGAYTVEYDFSADIAKTIVVDGDLVLTTPEGIAVTTPADIVYTLTPIEPCEG